jgi:CRISPR-associated protein Cas5d
MKPHDQAIEVWGELACFTRPELKVERFSYPVITPSAARGIYDAIYVKPKEFRWQVTRVEMLRPPAFIALRRNEVKEKGPSEKTVYSWAAGRSEPEPIWADGTEGEKGRTQRQTMALRNVRYRLHAEIRPWSGFEERLPGLEMQFRRRAAHGKCVYQPYFGCREFPAYFELVEVDAPQAKKSDFNLDLGFILYDVFDLSRPGTDTDPPAISVFRAIVRDGVLDVPEYKSEAVHKTAGSTSC